MAAYENQHFVPVFYSKRWTRSDGQLLRCVLEHRKFLVKPRGPAAIGCSRNLWSLDGVPDQRMRVTVERDFFSEVIDSRAAPVAKQMIEMPGVPLLEPHKIAWARFLVSLRYRNPIVVSHHLGEIAARALVDPDRPPDAIGDVPVSHANLRALLLREKVRRPQELELFYRDRLCSVLEIEDAPFKLLTSDWPLQRVRNAYGTHLPDSYVLPLSPTRLFLAAGSLADRDHWQRLNANQLVRTVNSLVTSTFLHDVWASDDSQLNFIERRMRDRGPFHIDMLLNQ